MQEVQRFNKVLKSFVLSGDIILLNLLLWVFGSLWGNRSPFEFSMPLFQNMALMTLCYLVCNIRSGVILHRPVVRPEQIMLRVARNMIPFVLIVLGLSYIFHFECSHENMQELYHSMTDDPTSGYRVQGYFEDFPSDRYPMNIAYLGQPCEAVDYLTRNAGKVDQLYCSLPSARSAEIVPIINYCENHLIRFFSVPNVRNYLKRRMYFEMLGNVPVLSIRREPLELLENRIVKRSFDIVCSLLFLCTLFPIIYIIVGLAIKISSPGPVFFKQKRSGEDGREFWCYKFRSMRVNAQCDTLQATECDPRKTRIGNLIRKTNVDELPQFINVLKGDMSLVGPRPHMLKHTEEYSHLINKYMVRHFVKPGITGWAQVTGFRGETKELWQMEGRVQRDIWYIEHWTFILDLYIMYKTVYNVIRGDKEAY